MKTIFFIASRFPYPLIGGREKTIVEYLNFLQSSSVKVHFYYFSNNPNKYEENRLKDNFSCISTLTSLNRPSTFLSLLNVIYFSLLKRSLSIQESFFYSKHSASILLRNFVAEKPDVVFFDMIRTAPYFLDNQFNATLTIFDMDDLISKRYAFLVKHDDIDVLGGFAKDIPIFLRRLANGLLKNILLKLEANLVSKNEVKYANLFNKTLLVSPVEAMALSKRIKLSKVSSVFSLYPSADLKLLPRERQLIKTIVFMGFLKIPHNRNALVTFLDKVFPIVLEKMAEPIQFLILGGGADDLLLQYSITYSSVKFLGFVDDYSSVLSKADVFVAPIYFGTGIKLKILDALGMGLPVVTTTIGAEGLLLENGVNAMIEDDYSTFASAVVRLLSDEQLNSTLSFAAFEYAKKYHEYDRLKNNFLNILEISNDN
jgi:glycosyltransferase involved in cell wall biosynthesis